ncbi:dGTPase [Enterobacter vonholyi]|uniref:dGTPase n=1 Tax=Enterobacter vonholyi TaxID=2797505 RepID=UPI002075845D|nr:dGTPase [Enterobacter vonholyi]MCM7621465.1 dGTPase [Enterobacter vonholyi]
MENLLSTKRHRTSKAGHKTFLSETQSDRARLIYSAAFRRLQQKAQVFSLESNSAVRSRLTHSIEVSHIGRYIVSVICQKMSDSETLSDEVKKYWQKNHLSIANMVEISCLAHDIGNPPFGHFGEAAIKEWAKSKEIIESINKSIPKKLGDDEISTLLSDFINFDGNPQGFRILTKLQGEDGLNGLNLTYSQLAAFLKYSFCPKDKPRDGTKEYPFSKKNGYFDTEAPVIYKAWKELGMPKNKRHPLSFLMEASDDISYCISDIEDGIEKKIIIEKEFFKFVIDNILIVKSKYSEHSEFCDYLIEILKGKIKNMPTSEFLFFKTTLSNKLVELVALKFIKNYNDHLNFTVDNQLISKNTFEYDILDILKAYTSKHLFTSYEAEKMELSGFAIIKGILEEYLKILALPKDKFKYLVTENADEINNNKLHIERRLYNRLPDKHIDAYKTAIAGVSIRNKKWTDERFLEKYCAFDAKHEWHLRAHLIVDFVSGMTDQFSMEIYHLLKGIKIK